MKCPECGGAIAELAKFCSNCGHKVRKSCPDCAAAIDEEARFCPECGAPQPRAPAPLPSGQGPSQAAGSAAPTGEDDGEYRQVTVMFCDLVESTQLSERLEAEDLRDVLRAFQQVSVQAIERLGGRVAKYTGDGMMALFGYPIAHEDAPKRGALAGLEILKQVEFLNADFLQPFDVSIKVRIGIHAGRVVAGEMGAGATREELSVVGVTPNIAARLEGLAPHDSVAISADMKRLIEDDFAFEPMGAHRLKGISEPMEAFRLLRPLAGGTVIPEWRDADIELSGRDDEVERLLAVWREVREGRDARLASVVGEPGIGKTGLAGLFLKGAGVDPARRVVLACSAYDQDTPFGPVVRMLADELGLAPEGGPREAEGGAERILAEANEVDRDALATLFRLLWRDPATDPRSGLEGRAERRELLRALIQYLKNRSGPLLLLLEDAHWADPSTIELIDRILRHSGDWAVFVLVLSRPDSAFPWDPMPATRLRLRGLSAQACGSIVLRLTEGRPLERRLLDHIMSVTEGVPLFVEELTKSLLEGGKLTERQGRLVLADLAMDLDTPITILDLLTARLDALGPAKELAQVAAVIGRSFDLDAVAFVSRRDAALVRQGLDSLIRSDFLVEHEDRGHGAFEFRHALYQKAAYDSLLRSRRRQLHARYLDWLEGDPDRKAATRPEWLAFYSEQAGFLETAVHYWIEAGEAANRASASQEAVQHFEGGLRILGDLPESEENHLIALRLLVLLGGARMMSQGPGAPETREVYQRALTLCEALPESPWHFPAYWGWWRVSENFTVMLKRAERLVAVAERMKEPEFGLQAHHCNWVNAFMVGDHETCLRHARKGLEIYEAGQFGELGSLYGGHDPKVCGLGETALSKWLIGEADQALEEVDRCLAWANEIGHLGSRLHALDIAVMLHHYRRDADAVEPLARELRSIGEKNELDDYRAKSLIFEGWCHADRGDLARGMEMLEEGLHIMREVGTREDFPVYFAMLAECHLKQGHHERALKLMEEGLSVIEEEGVAYWAPEIYRHFAETLMDMPEGDEGRMDAHLRMAIEISRSQKALALELRAACVKARQLERSGSRGKALALLRDVTGRFTEGMGTRDLQEALAHVAELEAAGLSASHEHV